MISWHHHSVPFNIIPHKFYQDGAKAPWFSPTSGCVPPPYPSPPIWGFLWEVGSDLVLSLNSHNLASILVGTASSDSTNCRYDETFFRILISQDNTWKVVWKMCEKRLTDFIMQRHIFDSLSTRGATMLSISTITCAVWHVLVSDERSSYVLISCSSCIEYKGLVLTCRKL